MKKLFYSLVFLAGFATVSFGQTETRSTTTTTETTPAPTPTVTTKTDQQKVSVTKKTALRKKQPVKRKKAAVVKHKTSVETTN